LGKATCQISLKEQISGDVLAMNKFTTVEFSQLKNSRQ